MDALELLKFCAEEGDIRWFMCKPYSRGDWTYATNGHILVRVPRIADVAEEEKAPNAEAVLEKIPAATTWEQVPQATMPPDLECEKCHGDGVRECDMDYQHDCDNCYGKGTVKQRIRMNVGNAVFDQRYIAMIQGWEIATNGEKFAARIRNGAVTGALMPMRAV